MKNDKETIQELKELIKELELEQNPNIKKKKSLRGLVEVCKLIIQAPKGFPSPKDIPL